MPGPVNTCTDRYTISVCNQPPASTQPSTRRGTVKWISSSSIQRQIFQIKYTLKSEFCKRRQYHKKTLTPRMVFVDWRCLKRYNLKLGDKLLFRSADLYRLFPGCLHKIFQGAGAKIFAFLSYLPPIVISPLLLSNLFLYLQCFRHAFWLGN